MIRIFALMVALIFALGGCSAMANDNCFTQRSLILPNRDLILSKISNGQSGREIAEAVLDDRIDDVVTRLKRDPRLMTSEVAYDRNKYSEQPDGQYGDLLTFAVSRCNLAMMKQLFDLGMPADGVQIGTALELALLSDRPEMAELLFQRGASPDPQKKGGKNLFTSVAAFRHVGGAMMLIRHGLDLNWEDEFGYNHLQTAVAMEQYNIAELLIEKGASPWRIGAGGAIPAQYFARPMILENPTENKVRLRLLAIVEKEAASKGFPWPLPDFKGVRQKLFSGEWPTPQMRTAGVPPVSPIVMDNLRKRFSKEIEQ
jgi:hypothetical protein